MPFLQKKSWGEQNMRELSFSLEPVSYMKRACFPLNEGETIDLHRSYVCLLTRFDSTECWYDENFKRLILKQPSFTVCIFYTGKVIVSGLFDDHDLVLFLSEIWPFFLKKNVQK